MSRPYPGRWLTFSDNVDFEHDRSMFKDIVYTRVGNATALEEPLD